MNTQLDGGGIDLAHMDGHRPLLRGQRHMAVAGHYLASQAALQILEAGGNAIDAGVAAGIAQVNVNGEIVLNDGEHTGATPGRTLARI